MTRSGPRQPVQAAPRCCCSTRRRRCSTASARWPMPQLRRRGPSGKRSGDSSAGCRDPAGSGSRRHYVETFDLRRRCALYLTYYRYGDTRKRGMAMLTFKAAYRAAGLEPLDDELPDYLPLVLDFAACPRAARRCCATTAPTWNCCCARCATGRVPLRRRRRGGLRAAPRPAPARAGLVRAVLGAGPPAEEVGLEPFAAARVPDRGSRRPEHPRGAALSGRQRHPDHLVGGAALPGAGHLRRRATSGGGGTTSSAGPAAPPSCRSGGCSNGAPRSSTTAPSPPSADTSSAS